MIVNPVVYGSRMETVKYTCTLDPKNGVTYKYLDESGQYAERSGIGEIHAVKNSIIYIDFNNSLTGWNHTWLNISPTRRYRDAQHCRDTWADSQGR